MKALLAKLPPKLKAVIASSQFAINSWKIANGAAALLLLLSILQFCSFYGDDAEKAMEQGKRVIVTLPEGEVIGRQIDEQKEEAAVAEGEAKEGAEGKEGEGEGEEKEERRAKEFKAFTGVGGIEDKRPRIAIIIKGLGLSKTSTEEVLTLPPEVTLSFSPYAYGLEEWVLEAEQSNFPVFLDLPLEPLDKTLHDPGPYSLQTKFSPQQNSGLLNALLGLTKQKKYGVVATLEERFTFSRKGVTPILEQLRDQNLVFIYTNQPRNYFLGEVADDLGLQVLVHDVVLDGDSDLSDEGIDVNLLRLEAAAAQKGYALGVGRPYPVTVDRIKEWAAGLEEKGFVLVDTPSLLEQIQ